MNSRKTIVLGILATLLFLTPAQAISGPLADDLSAWSNYRLLVPPAVDPKGDLMIRQAIYCFSLAVELRKAVPDENDVATFQEKCNAKDPSTGFYSRDPEFARDRGLQSLVGAFLEVYVHILASLPSVQ